MLTLYGAFPEEFDPAATPFFVEIDGLDVPFYCSRFERRGQTGAVAAFEDMDERTPRLGAARPRIPHRDGFGGGRRRIPTWRTSWASPPRCGRSQPPMRCAPRGLRCRAAGCRPPHCGGAGGCRSSGAGSVPGEVVDFYDNGANPLFELELDGRRVLVPAVEEFIARIDFEERTMKFVLPAGLVAPQS